jgi:hypothetical protein
VSCCTVSNGIFSRIHGERRLPFGMKAITEA